MDQNKAFANLPAFSCMGIPLNERRNKWSTWKRGYEICLRAAKITESSEKKDLLLAYGGFELQEIFFSIPGADVTDDKDKSVDSYKVAIDKLDSYFAPQRHEAHERYLFWAMKPEPEESLEKFLMRTQMHASKCNFGKTQSESAGIAVMDKMLQFVPAQLRERLLQSSDLSVEEVVKQINAYVATRSASDQMSGQVKPATVGTDMVQRVHAVCKFCGRAHESNQQCPAWNKTCSKCGKRGHFRATCYSRAKESSGSGTSGFHPGKRSFNQGFPSSSSSDQLRNKKGTSVRRLHAIDDSDMEENVELVEMVSCDNDCDDLVWATVGGVLIEMQIDSGVESNIIDNETWDTMVRNGVKTTRQSQRPDKKFRAYAQKDYLVVINKFEADIVIDDGNKELKTVACFYVVKDGPQPLLGKKTAKELGVLIVGLPSRQQTVHQVEVVRPFPSIRGVKIHIPVDRSVQPVAQRLRRLPFATLEKVDEKLKDLLAKDIIERVTEPSRWVSPMVIVVKDSGDIRLCIDMRQVNKAILRETHPLPTLEDIRWKLNGAVYFSRLDIKDAFHQLELDDESKPLTTFITHKGLFRYKRMVFGISCAPEMFQKVIEQILANCPNTINFIDDIIIVGKTEEEHDRALQSVLTKFRDYGILLNQSKCAFKLSEIDFLGHRFSKFGVLPSDDKVEAIRNFRSPITSEEVRSFLGLVNYVGAFIPDLATVSFPLRELTKAKEPFKWGTDEQDSFAKLVELIGQVQNLSHFDPKLKTRVVADASPVGLGAVLLQFHEGTPKVVSYASKSLTDTEKRYAQTEKEALALVWAVERFQIYLIGVRFELETDHKPLEAIFSPDSKPCLRIERWVLRLQAFSYDVVYRKGKTNIADCLSRLSNAEVSPFDPDSEVYIRSVLEHAAIDLDEFEVASERDSEMSELREFLNRGVWNYTSQQIKPYHAFRNELGKVGDLVVRGSRLIVPKALRNRMLNLAHEGHPGRTKMQQRLRQTCWWPGMDDSVARVVDLCEGCRLVSLPERPEPMQRRKLPESPWVDVAIDFLGPLPSGDYLLVIIDYFSRYKEVEVLRKITASETANRLEHIFVRLGYPRTITLDNGRQFVSNEFDEYCKIRGIILNRTTPYWPQENGLVERQNRSLVKRLKISQALKKDWKQDLQAYLSMYYSTPQSTTGKTPTELMYGRNIRTKLPSLQDVSTAIPFTGYSDRDQQAKERGKEKEDDRRRAKPSDLVVGDKVLLKNLLPSNKLDPVFNPSTMTVTAKEGARVTVEDNNGRVYQRNSSHLKKLRSDQNTEVEVQVPTEAASVGDQREVVEPLRGSERSGEHLDGPTSILSKNAVQGASDPSNTSVSACTPVSVSAEPGRTRRNIRMPNRFNDCVMEY